LKNAFKYLQWTAEKYKLPNVILLIKNNTNFRGNFGKMLMADLFLINYLVSIYHPQLLFSQNILTPKTVLAVPGTFVHIT